MLTPSFKEDHISQIPALQFLQNLGYIFLSQEEALNLRENRTSEVILEPILRDWLTKNNRIEYKGETFKFDEGNINTAIQAIKTVPLQDGLIEASAHVYDLIVLGKALEQSNNGDKKSFTLQYIDWKNWENNVFHITEEYSVMRSGSTHHYRPDLVLFVNGIPLCVIECKRPDIKEPIEQAISQHLRNQQADGIQQLFAYSQINIGVATHYASYGTTATVPKFWTVWKEQFKNDIHESEYHEKLVSIKNASLPSDSKDKVFSSRYKYVRGYFNQLEHQEIEPTLQDSTLYGLCAPDRLLDLIHNFVIYDGGVKKISRYQQYFAVKKTMDRITSVKAGKRKGGVIWHTTGVGKSLTMVLLAQHIAMSKKIKNPKIVLVTDRTNLDTQITKTFQKCEIPVLNANTGANLVDLLNNKGDSVITTIINKFISVAKRQKEPFLSSEIFVLIDESHRSQYGTFNINMQMAFPNACFIGLTGTPLMKKEKNTADKFGGFIDKYTITQAVEDGVVVPLLYEGRHTPQKVNTKPIDDYFNLISEPLNDYQKLDLKKKFSRADQLNVADQKIFCNAWDISKHFDDNWGETKEGIRSEFKGMVVCQSKKAAIQYKKCFDDINNVSSEIVISAPDQREGYENAYGDVSDEVQRFWKQMMNEHRTPKKYEDNLVARFTYQEEPQLLIVVDKLLTGFDAPRAIVLYLTRSLKEHSLLQAMARVNRIHPGKDFGYIVDYYGILGELDQALTNYSGLEGFEEKDLEGTVISVNQEVTKLPQAHTELWSVFKEISNRGDETAYEEFLRNEAFRAQFYDKLSAYLRVLKIALSTLSFYKDNSEKEIENYKKDAGFFQKLRISVRQRYSDSVDFKNYESQIQKLIDKHVVSSEVLSITGLVNIFDTEKFQEEVEKIVGEAAKADTIASRTAKYISEKMEEDPAFYKKFSDLLKEVIKEYEEKRLSEADYLKRVDEIHKSVLNHTNSDIPQELREHQVAQAFYGVALETIKKKEIEIGKLIPFATYTALGVDSMIRSVVLDNGNPVIDWPNKRDLVGPLHIDLGDYIMDEICPKFDLKLTFGEIDMIVGKSIEIAKKRYN